MKLGTHIKYYSTMIFGPGATQKFTPYGRHIENKMAPQTRLSVGPSANFDNFTLYIGRRTHFKTFFRNTIFVANASFSRYNAIQFSVERVRDKFKRRSVSEFR